jgi:hypothetical protein
MNSLVRFLLLCQQLDDTEKDVPMAPKLLAETLAAVIALATSLELSEVGSMFSGTPFEKSKRGSNFLVHLVLHLAKLKVFH